MKLLLFMVNFILLDAVFTKGVEKIIKKDSTLLKKKPVKNSKTTIEAFKDLSSEDLEFIKELDRQFKLHGNSIKIKIELDNSTKNTKRTVDDDLGYGFMGNYPRYHFSQKKYVIYPYSQEDIPPLPVQNRKNHVTESFISSSHSYEVQPISSEHDSYNPQSQLIFPAYYDQQNYEHQELQNIIEPVIILRIPGPAKYSSHLQTLLQKYIELRAAQYVKDIRENDSRHKISPSKFEKQHNEHQYATPPQQLNYQQPMKHYLPSQQTGTQTSVPQVTEVQNIEIQPHIEDAYQKLHFQTAAPQFHYHSKSNNNHQLQLHPHEHPSYKDLLITKTQPSVHYNYESNSNRPSDFDSTSHFIRELVYVPHFSPQITYDDRHRYSKPKFQHHIQISENNPSSTHTKVLFTDEQSYQHQVPVYPLPSMLTAPRKYEPAPVDKKHYKEHYPDIHSTNSQADYRIDDNKSFVAITQKPFNYHAHFSERN